MIAPAIWPAVVGTSVAVFAGHVATFVIAARAVGVTESMPRLVPLAMFVLLVAPLPANVGGWGPREGAAAWTFAVAGLGGAQGVAAATAYGVLAAAASLPGAVVLVAGWWTHRTPVAWTPSVPQEWNRSVSWSVPMADRPYTLLSCGVSLDGYLDSPTSAGSGCRTTPISIVSMRCGRVATRSSSARTPSEMTIRGC